MLGEDDECCLPCRTRTGSKRGAKQVSMTAHTFTPSIQEAEAGNLREFEATLIYIVTSRTARGICMTLFHNHKGGDRHSPLQCTYKWYSLH